MGAAWELLAVDWWKRQLSFKEIWAQQGRGAKEWWQSEALFAEPTPPPPVPLPSQTPPSTDIPTLFQPLSDNIKALGNTNMERVEVGHKEVE